VKRAISFEVNGERVALSVEPRRTLLDVVRDDLGLTGTHAGCEQGACGACTVMIDGAVCRSCLVLAVQADGHRVDTIESVGTPESLHPVQAALSRHHGLQCGFCTPGVVLTAIDLLSRSPHPDEAEVREAMAGNLCRCTGYAGLVAAVVALGAEGPVAVVGGAAAGAEHRA
jgi:carbon-monoxide dehydrogenase small subunit